MNSGNGVELIPEFFGNPVTIKIRSAIKAITACHPAFRSSNQFVCGESAQTKAEIIFDVFLDPRVCLLLFW